MNSLKWTNSWRLGGKKKQQTPPMLSLCLGFPSRKWCSGNLLPGVVQNLPSVRCDSDSCRKTWVLVRTRGRKWEVPNVSAIKKQNQKILWSQASVVFSLFCLLTLLGGFQEELQNSTQHHPWWEPPWELAGHIPIRLSVWGELWPWCRQLIWLHEPVPKVMYVKHGQAD